MKIKSIEMENIRSYEKERIEFPSGSLLLAGDIGSGKSTILMAIDFALFGLRRGEISGSDLLRHGKSSGYVKLSFSLNSKDIVIKRILKDSRGISQDSGYIEINGLRTELAPSEMKARIIEMLGYPKDMIRKNKPIFKYTVYTPQEEMKNIMLNPLERMEILRKIFDIEKYGQIRNNGKIIVTEMKSIKKVYDALSKDLEEQEKRREEKSKDLEIIKNSIEDRKRKIERINQSVEKKKAGMEKIAEERKLLDEIRIKIARSEAETRSKEKHLLDVKRSLEENNKKIDKLEAEIRGIIAPDINAKETGESILSLRERKEKIIFRRAVLESNISKLNSILYKGRCEVCGQDVFDTRQFERNIENLEKELEYENSSLKKLEEKIKELEKEKQNADKIKQEIFRKTMLERSLAETENQKIKLEREKELLVKEIKNLREEITVLKPGLEAFSRIEEELKRASSEMDLLLKERLEEEKALSKLEQQSEDIEREIEALERETAEKKILREKSRKISITMDWMDSFFSPLMETIEKHVMLSIQSEFNLLFQKWFGIIMGEEIMNVRIDDSFNPVIEQNGYETDYFNLSGGEKTSVALSYRLALNHVINSLIENIRTKDLLILDEPTDGFSSEQLDRIRDVISELNLGQVILVSHEPKIDTFVDNVIRLYKQNHVTSVG